MNFNSSREVAHIHMGKELPPAISCIYKQGRRRTV